MESVVKYVLTGVASYGAQIHRGEPREEIAGVYPLEPDNGEWAGKRPWGDDEP